jgi:hypothetical protein
MTYKSRQYGEKDGHKLMKAITAQGMVHAWVDQNIMPLT